MLDVLLAAEKELPALLEDAAAWRGLYIDYHPPTVERLWRNWNRYRLSLHRIYPCAAGEALFHPHPWPSAMRVLEGRYEMAVGYGPGLEAPPIAARLMLGADSLYEMTHPDAWHYVRPLEAPSLSLMVTGPPWERPAPGSGKELRSLDAEEAAALLACFRQRYPRGN
jgi:hypothetical protein